MLNRQPLNLSGALQVIRPCVEAGGQVLVYNSSGAIVHRSGDMVEVTVALKVVRAGTFAIREHRGGYSEHVFYIANTRG